MRIVFSVYKKDFNTDKTEQVYCESLKTTKSLEEIDPLVDIKSGFESELIVGRTLSFYDIYCYQGQENDIIDRIKEIPRSSTEKEEKSEKEPKILVIKQYNEGDVQFPVKYDPSRYYFYRISRYECGASGISEFIALIQSDPIFANIISTVIITAFTSVVGFICKSIKKKYTNSKQIEKYIFKIKKYKKQFSEYSNVNSHNFQIIKLEKIRNYKYRVYVRTCDNKTFSTIATSTGEITSLDLISENDIKILQ